MNKISAVIITLNEERNIARCINSLKGVADEIIVADSFSADDTKKIAEELGADVYQYPFRGYGEHKNLAVSHARYDWILNLDADEALSPELAESILSVKAHAAHDAYSFNRLTNYCGRWIRHCGWYPDAKIRLWNRHKARMSSSKVHEGISLTEGRAGFLKGDLLHYCYPTISAHIKKIEQYSEIGARYDAEQGKKCSVAKMILAPWLQFLSLYFLRLGFLDGYYGFIICINSAFASFTKYAKLREYIRQPA